MVETLSAPLLRIMDNRQVAVVVCACGRALDVATTWVALDAGHATEAKHGTAQFFHLLGTHTGIIAYELCVTTPLIFLGCALGQRLWRALSHTRPASKTHAPAPATMLLYSIGVISLIVAGHNLHFLL